MQYWKGKGGIFRTKFRRYLVWGIKRMRSWQSCIQTSSTLPHYLDSVQTGRASKTLSVVRFTSLSNLSLSHSFLVPSHWNAALCSTYWLHFHTRVPFHEIAFPALIKILFIKTHIKCQLEFRCAPKALWSCFNYHTYHRLTYQASFCPLWEQRQHLALILGILQIANVTKNIY